MVIRDISDTARWVAVYRAMESERPDALFRDPYARRLAGERGAAIAREMPYAMAGAWALIVRTALIDEIVLRLTGTQDAVPAPPGQRVVAVLNLACGLDTRPYRLPLPRQLRWIEVDLPGILDYKEEALAGEVPVCDLERVRLDLADRAGRRALLARVAAPGAPVLVISEGLLVYLQDAMVKELAADLASEPALHWWLVDLVSPGILRRVQRSWNASLSAANAPMRFAPPNGTAFFHPFGWTTAEMRPIFVESRRLHREMPQARRPLQRAMQRLVLSLLPNVRRDILRTGVALLGRQVPYRP
jgi:methyltransferase (TIGR00027 family)